MSRSQRTLNQSTAGRAAQHRGVMIRRILPSNALFVSPIERWPDTNYAPQELEFVLKHNTDSTEVVAPLHGFEPNDVQFDISRDHLIILLSYIGSTTYPSRQEFYCEVPLSPDVKQTGAVVEFHGDFMTVRLEKKSAFVQRAASVGSVFKHGLALLFGKNWTMGRFDY